MKFAKLAATAAVAALAATGAGAATLSLAGTGYQSKVLGHYDLTPDLDGETISYITGSDKNATNGLKVDGPARVTYTYIGSEAGNYNATMAGLFSFDENAAVGTMAQVWTTTGGLLDFLFKTIAPASAASVIYNNAGANPIADTFAIGYYQDGDSWYALFDDIQAGDRDFDDFVLKIDVAPVPLPAAGLLLLGGIGAMAAAGRRRRKVA